MSDGILSVVVFDVARIFSGIGSRDVPDEEGSIGLLSNAIAGCKSDSFNFPSYNRLRYTNGQTRQCDVFFVSSRESVVERSDSSRHYKKITKFTSLVA